MAEAVYVETMGEENSEYMDLMEYMDGFEEDISSLGLNVNLTEQLRTENEFLESRSLETMMTYFMILEEELTIEKQKALRLRKVNQEIERDRHEIEELNKELMKQKHKLETENQQLRQRLLRRNGLFSKITDELGQLRRQNRMLHAILEMNKNSSKHGKREENSSQILSFYEILERYARQNSSQRSSNLDDEGYNTSTSELNIQSLSSKSLTHNDDICHKDHNSLPQDFITLNQDSSQTLPRCEKLESYAHQNSSQCCSNLDDEDYNTSKSELNIQSISSQSLTHNDDVCHKDHNSLPLDFITLNQAQQKNNHVGVTNTTNFEGKSKQQKHEAEELSTKEGSVKTESIEECYTEDIPIMPAPLPKDLLILFGNDAQSNGKNKHSREEDIKKLEERNSRLTRALQRLEMHCHHEYLNSRYQPRRQNPEEKIFKATPRKVYPGCNAKEEALLKAVKAGSVTRVRQVISEGVDVNHTLLGKWSPLHIAAAFGFNHICEELLDAGAQKHATDRWGDTPLHWAAVNGCKEVASVLVDHGDDVFKCGRGNRTPREKALAAGHNDLADWFAKKEQEQRKSSTET